MQSLPTYRAAILLSAFGACPYLREQVRSIVQQMSEQDVLVMVDDGSRNVLWEVIDTWPPNFIAWSRLSPLGASRSFLSLVVDSAPHAQHYFLVDQDDIWLPGKIDLQVQLQSKAGSGLHASTHHWSTDVAPVHDLSHSALTCRHAPLPCFSPAHYCFETPAPGMTVAFNAACRDWLVCRKCMLLKMAINLPHDRILFAAFSTFAKIHIVQSVLVQYRQHQGNLVGAAPAKPWLSWRNRLWKPARAYRTAVWGAVLYDQLQSELCPSRLEPLQEMTLRSDYWDNRCIHLLLWLRHLRRR